MNYKKKKRRKIVLVFVMFVTVLIVLQSLYIQNTKAKKISENIGLGNQYLSELNYEQAIASYRIALDIDGKNAEAELGLAQAYEASQMYKYAEEAYKNLLEMSGKDKEAYNQLVHFYLRQDRHDEAEQLLAEAVEETGDEELKLLYEEAHPAAPVMSYASGTYKERIKVELTASDARHIIFYTLDGTMPDINSQVYSKPVILPNGETQIKAVAVNSMGFQSVLSENTYRIDIQDRAVQIEEPVIEQIVRETMQIPDSEAINNDDIERMTELYVVGWQVATGEDLNSVVLEAGTYTVNGNVYETDDGFGVIRSLQDLINMPFLEKVVIAYQPELDISALASLDNLKEVSLVGNHLINQDISVLAGLEGLEVLNLGWNSITDISVLADLTNLTSLGIWGNKIRSVSIVQNMQYLEYLDFSDNLVSDISSIENLTNIKELWMYHNQIRDISSVAGLRQIKVLMLNGNPVEELGAIHNMYPRLERIDVDVMKLGERES